MDTYTYVGIDVGKYELDSYLNDHHCVYENTSKRIAALIRKLNKLTNCLVVFEATGGYERGLKLRLAKKGYAYHVAHANKIRAFAKAKGLLAKTDKIDAKLIKHYADTMVPEPDEHDEHEFLRSILKRREQLIGEKNREANRLLFWFDSFLPVVAKQSNWW